MRTLSIDTIDKYLQDGTLSHLQHITPGYLLGNYKGKLMIIAIKEE